MNIGNPPPKALVADPNFASEPDEPSIETAEVSIDADEVAPEVRVVPVVKAAVDEDVEVVAVSDDSGELDVDVAVDVSTCSALGAAAELSGDTVWTPVPADVPAACETAVASPLNPDELVVAVGVVKGVMVEAAVDAPA